jgi:DNA-binding MarR family transcriptional regulator
MADEATIRALERVIVGGGAITSAAVIGPPEARALTLGQYRALSLVASSADGLRIVELARRKGRQPQAATKIIQRLEAKGLVWLERGAGADRRAVVVRLTELGEHAWAKIGERRRELLAAALEGAELPADAAALLRAVAAAIERHNA